MRKYKIAGFIPAKGESKRIPRKNMKMMAGKPMMAWTIEASLKSKYIDRTFVSTEDAEIKKIALEYGVEVVDRPPAFSEDESAAILSYYHFKYYLLKNKYKFDYIIFLFATSPLRTEKHIDGMLDLHFQSKYQTIIAVHKTKYWTPASPYFINESGNLENIKNAKAIQKEWGQKDVYVGDPSMEIYDLSLDDSQYYEGYGDLRIGRQRPYIMKPEECIDVDTPYDFAVAEALLKERIKEEKKMEELKR